MPHWHHADRGPDNQAAEGICEIDWERFEHLVIYSGKYLLDSVDAYIGFVNQPNWIRTTTGCTELRKNSVVAYQISKQFGQYGSFYYKMRPVFYVFPAIKRADLKRDFMPP